MTLKTQLQKDVRNLQKDIRLLKIEREKMIIEVEEMKVLRNKISNEIKASIDIIEFKSRQIKKKL